MRTRRPRVHGRVKDEALLRSIAELYQRGMKLSAIRRRFRCGSLLIHHALRKHGVPVARTRNHTPPESVVWEMAKQLREARCSRSSPEALTRRECRANPEEWRLAFLAAEGGDE